MDCACVGREKNRELVCELARPCMQRSVCSAICRTERERHGISIILQRRALHINVLRMLYCIGIFLENVIKGELTLKEKHAAFPLLHTEWGVLFIVRVQYV